jgi:cell shape-determining protein MreD
VRTATIVLAAYALCVICGACWRLLPTQLLRDAVPELGALTSAYLGLTARRGLAPAVCGSVVIGYLADVISGVPAGLAALVLGVTCLVTRSAQQRILVRGAVMTIAFSAFIALVSNVVGLIVRAAAGIPVASITVELQHLALVVGATALIGPLVWRVFRRIDAAFARTHREREAALEGLMP